MAYRGQILGRNWDKSLKSFPSCYSQSPLLTGFTLRQQKWFETGLKCKHCIQKCQVWELLRLCLKTTTKLYVHEFSFSAATNDDFISFQVQGAMLGEWYSELCQMFSGFCFPILIFRQEGENAICWAFDQLVEFKKNFWSVSDNEGLYLYFTAKFLFSLTVNNWFLCFYGFYFVFASCSYP